MLAPSIVKKKRTISPWSPVLSLEGRRDSLLLVSLGTNWILSPQLVDNAYYVYGQGQRTVW